MTSSPRWSLWRTMTAPAGGPGTVPPGPPLTAAQLADEFASVAGVEAFKLKTIPAALLKAGGLFSPMIRELPEMPYQFERSFVIEATDTTEPFAIVPTPLEQQLRATIASYRSLGRETAPVHHAAA